MQPLAKQVLEHAAGLPEGTPLVAKELLHLGKRTAVDQALSRLVQRGALMRAGRGIRSAAASEPVLASGADARGKRDQGWVGTARPCPHLSMAMRSVKLRELPAGAETPSAQPPDANLAIRTPLGLPGRRLTNALRFSSERRGRSTACFAPR